MQLMLSIGPMARSVHDLRSILPILAGRDARDPRSVNVPHYTCGPGERVAGIVTALPGGPLPRAGLEAVRRAGTLLAAAGWRVEEVTPPGLSVFGDLFENLLVPELEALAQQIGPIVSDELLEHLRRLAVARRAMPLPIFNIHAERARLIREWSQFFGEYPLLVGPTLAAPIWQVDADLRPQTGIDLLRDATRFILPGSVLGIPCLAVPMSVENDPPDSVLLYADLWREDVCFAAALALEDAVPARRPVNLSVPGLPNSGLQQAPPSRSLGRRSGKLLR